MKILTTTLEGFGPHEEAFTVDWSQEDTVLALVAHNGAGKTFLIEADFACLYGDFPSYKASIYEALTQHGTGKGRLETTFQINGTTYRAERTVFNSGKTRRQTATLYEDGEAVAGPKVRDFDQAIETRFGHRSTALASWCSAQGAIGDLVLLSPAERRGVFVELLGLNRLDEIAAQARDAAKVAETETATLTTLIGQYTTLKEDRKAHRQGLAEAADTHERLTAELTQIDQDLATTQQEVTEYQSLYAIVQQALNQQSITINAHHQCDLERADLGQTRSNALKRQQFVTRIQQYIELQSAQELESRLVSYQAYVDQHTALTQEISTLETTTTSREAFRPTTEQISAAADFEDNEKLLATALEAEAQSIKLRAFQKATRNAKQNELDTLPSEHPETPGAPDVCAQCVLYQHISDQQGRREALSVEIDVLDKALQAATPETNVERLREQVQQGREGRAALTKWTGIESEHNKLTRRLTACRGKLRVLETDAPQVSGEDVQALETAKYRSASLLSGLRADLENLREIQSLDALLIQNDRDTLLAWSLAEAASKEYEEQHALMPSAQVLLESQQNITRFTQRHQDITRQLQILEKAQVALEVRLEQTETQLKEVRRQKARIKKLTKRSTDLRALQQAFGRTGVQALIVDTALVGLQDATNTLLATLSDDRFQLELDTQSETRDGRLREDLAIRIYDGDTVREVGQFSGGEKRLFQIALRLGLTVWSNQAHGRAAGTLRIDEAFDALDEDRAHNVTELLATLTDTFGQIVVVTHNHSLAALLPGQISL